MVELAACHVTADMSKLRIVFQIFIKPYFFWLNRMFLMV